MSTLALVGFLRLHVEPTVQPARPTVLLLQNPHVARSILAIDGQALGEVPPLGRVEIRGLPEGRHTVGWTTPAGFTRRSEAVASTAPPPAR